jgi:hypothetical protein
MSEEYEEGRDRNMAVAGSEFVKTIKQAVISAKNASHCEYILGETEGRRYTCGNKQRYWVQRGSVNRVVCHQHLARTVNEFWQIKPGRYGVTESSEGYWISTTSVVVIKMRVSPEGLWR